MSRKKKKRFIRRFKRDVRKMVCIGTEKQPVETQKKAILLDSQMWTYLPYKTASTQSQSYLLTISIS